MPFESIPQELKDRPQWVCWRAKAAKKKDGAKKTDKIPVDAKTGKNASTTDPKTWSPFPAACASVDKFGLAGVGFVFSGDDPYIGVDFDDCRNGGICSADVANVTRALGSYGEVSQSGNGVHVILKGCLPQGPRRNSIVEIYSEGRFFVCTGDRLPWTPETVEHRQAALDEFYSTTFGVVPTGKSTATSVSATDLEQLTDDIQRLIQGGRTSGFDAATLTDMLAADKQFSDTWHRKRREFGDDASRYDASLAWHGILSGLSVEDICKLITDHRRVHRDDPKCKAFRADYLARTILWCRNGEVNSEVELLKTIDKQTVNDARDGGSDKIIDEIRVRTGFDEFAGIVKYGQENAKYYMVLVDGSKFCLGDASVMLTLNFIQKPIYNATGKLLRALKKHQWELVAQLLHAVAELRPIEDDCQIMQLKEWIESYLQSTRVYEERERSASPEAMAEDAPFVIGNVTYLRLGKLKHFVSMVLNERVESAALRVLLREAGFSGKTLSARHPETQGVIRKYYYLGRIDV